MTYSAQNELSELEQEGLIQRFEYTHELAWKTLQDLFKEKGYEDAVGPNPVLKRAFSDGFITDGEGWGIYTVVGGLFLLRPGSQTDKTESSHLFGIFIDLGIAILFIIFFLLYVLVFLFLYFVLIYHPAKKKTEAGLMEKVWEARNRSVESNHRNPSEGNPSV